MAASINASAQVSGVEFRPSYGFLVRHHLDMGLYTQTHFPAFEMSVVQQTNGRRKWHHLHHFPDQGLSIFYSGLGNSEILGSVTAIVPWIRIPVLTSQRAGMHFRIGTGLGYFNKKFDPVDNYKNLAIGSHLNACIYLGTEFRFKIGERFGIFAGLGWTHFSNGSIKAPNYGINMPNVNAGISFRTGKIISKHQLISDSLQPRHSGLNLSLSHGVKQILPLNGPLYHVVAATVSYGMPIQQNGMLSFNLDLTNDQSDKSLLERKGIQADDAFGLLKTGVSAGIASRFGRTSLSFTLGTYLAGKEKSDGDLYDRIGLDVLINNRLSALVYLKTHYAKADFIGWGIQYRILNF